MTAAHAHRWRLLAATPASDAVCRECGERRRFTGGVRADATGTVPSDRTCALCGPLRVPRPVAAVVRRWFADYGVCAEHVEWLAAHP